jgi:hypothetical protein
MPRTLYPQGKNPWYPLDRRLGGPQSRSGRGGEKKNSQPPPGLRIQEMPHVNKDPIPIIIFLLYFMDVTYLLVAETNKLTSTI